MSNPVFATLLGYLEGCWGIESILLLNIRVNLFKDDRESKLDGSMSKQIRTSSCRDEKTHIPFNTPTQMQCVYNNAFGKYN
jgi:hypothetical protein